MIELRDLFINLLRSVATQITNMKLFFTVIILIVSFQSWIKADDITDFEIEGISVGDNLLDHFSDDQINNAYKNTYPKSKKYYGLQFELDDYELYKFIQIHLQSNTKYIVSSIAGGEFFEDMSKCYSKQKKITNDLVKNYPNAKLLEGEINGANDPETLLTISEFNLNNFEFIVTCTDWSKNAEETGNSDSLRVEISTTEFSDFLRNEAY